MENLLVLLMALVASVSKVNVELGKALEVAVNMMRDKWEDSLDRMERDSQELAIYKVELENKRKDYNDLARSKSQVEDDAIRLRELCDGKYWEVKVSCNALISHKLVCIKALREITGLGLLEAKQKIEQQIVDNARLALYNLTTEKMLEAIKHLTRSDVSSVNRADIHISLV
jgi:ribosomal protein L7/L12